MEEKGYVRNSIIATVSNRTHHLSLPELVYLRTNLHQGGNLFPASVHWVLGEGKSIQ